MPKRENLDRESLEVHLLNLLMGYRPLLLIGGLMFLVFTFFTIQSSLIVGLFALGTTVVMVLLASTYQGAVYMAKALAWVGTVWKRGE